MIRLHPFPEAPAMGNFYVNFATRGPGRDAVAQFLRSAQRIAFVAPTIDGVTMFFDRESDAQKETVVQGLAKRASAELNAPVLAALNDDDDLLMLWLFQAGEGVDQYDSCPGCLDDDASSDEDDHAPAGGDATKLCAAFGVPASKAAQVENVLRGDKYRFAFQRHKALADLLNLPWPYACTGYEYIDRDSLSRGLGQADFLAIG
jgi:hypothetical protein